MESNSRIYVAGHTGLVGSAIWRNLQSKGYSNLIGRSFEELDLRNQQSVEEFFASEKPEYVILAAAKVGGIMANNTYRADFIYENLMIESNIIHQAYVHGVKKLLFLGSTCIYPKECPQPMKEEYLLTGLLESTNEPYAIAKIAGIKLCESYNLQYGTNFISVMPTNLYGPNDNFDLEKSHVLPALLRKVHLGKLLEDGNFEALAADLQDVKTLKLEYQNRRDASHASTSDFNKKNITEVLESIGVSRFASRVSHHDSRVSHHDSPVTVEIWGSGTPMREFMWSEDMADACVYLLERDDQKVVILANARTPSLPTNAHDGTPKLLNSSPPNLLTSLSPKLLNSSPPKPLTSSPSFVNIGTGHEISIRDLAHLIKRIVGFKGELVFNASKPDGTMRKVTDVSRLHSLGWKHQVELEEGVGRLYEWYLGRGK